MKHLAVVLSSSILVACGGGGSDAPTSSPSGVSLSAGSPTTASPAIEALVKYEGVWREDCKDHMRLTKTATATSGTTFSVSTKEEYFDNADCTGALVATGSFSQPDEAVQYSATLVNASVTLLTGETIVSNVDPATSVLAVAPFTFTGSHVTSTYALGTTFARIEYADGSYVIVQRQALNGGTTHGALLLRNDELLALVPTGGSTTSFQVNHRYIR
ncbi:MAG: hypothetical protein ABI606_05695 [Rhodoferax sp.]